VIVSRFPYPLEKGDKLRAFHQLRELSKKFSVTLFAITDHEPKAEHLEAVAPYCKNIHVGQINFLSKSFNMFMSLLNGKPFQVGYFMRYKLKKELKSIIEQNNFKHIYCQLIRCSEHVKDIHIPKTIDYMDAFAFGMEKRIETQPFYLRWLFRSEAKRLKQYEAHIFDYFEHHTIISEQDKARIIHPSTDNISIVANGISPDFFEDLERDENYDFVFVGNMSYAPNVNAMQYFINDILPKFPTSKLLIAGASPDPKILKLAKRSEQVDVSGWVEDIRTSYCNGKIFIAPMQIGTGLQNKLLEAMALQTPCVTTPIANNALGAIDEESILIGKTSEELIDKLQSLLDSEVKRKKIAMSGMNFVKENYSWTERTKPLLDLLEKSTKSDI
jgi:sugar transferase (PEP-CTERM/EpsH1 system associated)